MDNWQLFAGQRVVRIFRQMDAGNPQDAPAAFPGPLIVCGMHRSGTSLTAAVLAGAGLHLGDELLGASRDNQRGHFEDLEILAFHRNVLVANGLLSEGYTTQAEFMIPERLRRLAVAHVAARGGWQGAWGWKEPRTTLFLDFWRELVPDARFLLLFRRPWEVVDSLLRRNEATFHWNPGFAVDVWQHYNARLLKFAEQHPADVLVAELHQVIGDPHSLVATVRQRFGLELSTPTDCYEPELLGRNVAPSQLALFVAACPQAYELYLRLRTLAGSESPLPNISPAAGDAASLRDHVLTAWGQATQYRLRCHEAEQRCAEAAAARRWHARRWRGLIQRFPRQSKAA